MGMSTKRLAHFVHSPFTNDSLIHDGFTHTDSRTRWFTKSLAHWLTHSLIDSHIHWLTHPFIDWLVRHWFAHSLIHSFIDSQRRWCTHSFTNSSPDSLIHSPSHSFVPYSLMSMTSFQWHLNNLNHSLLLRLTNVPTGHWSLFRNFRPGTAGKYLVCSYDSYVFLSKSVNWNYSTPCLGVVLLPGNHLWNFVGFKLSSSISYEASWPAVNILL